MKQAASRISFHARVRHARRTARRLFILACALLLPTPHAGFAAAETVAVKGPLIRGPGPGSAVEQVRNALPQVYRLMVDVDGAMKGGTAFLVSGQRVIATNNHVVDGGRAFWLGYLDAHGEVRRTPLHLIATFPQKDLALLEAFEDLPGKPLPLATQIPAAASNLYAIGFPAAADLQGGPSWGSAADESYFRPSVLVGYVSRVLTNRWLTSRLQHQTPIIPGYSGGPLVNDDGAVVGISTSIHKEANGISYAVLAADLAELTTACALPTAGDRLPQPAASARETGIPPAAGNRMNTHALQPWRPLTREEAALLNRAEIALESGAVLEARSICNHLVKTTHTSESYVCLARTYDPEIFMKVGAEDLPGNAGLAEFYYGRAGRIRKHGRPAVEPAVAETPRWPVPGADGRACDASLCKLVSHADTPVVSCEPTHRH